SSIYHYDSGIHGGHCSIQKKSRWHRASDCSWIRTFIYLHPVLHPLQDLCRGRLNAARDFGVDTQCGIRNYFTNDVQIRSPLMATSGDYLRLHFIVFLWGFSAILGKLITLSAVELIWYRAFFAAVGMALVIMLSRGTFKVSGADTLRLVGIGTIVAMHWFSFFGSARLSNVSVSLVGFATNSLWAALL